MLIYHTEPATGEEWVIDMPVSMKPDHAADLREGRIIEWTRDDGQVVAICDERVLIDYEVPAQLCWRRPAAGVVEPRAVNVGKPMWSRFTRLERHRIGAGLEVIVSTGTTWRLPEGAHLEPLAQVARAEVIERPWEQLTLAL